MFTMSTGRTLGSSLLFGKSYRSLSYVSSVLFGHLLRTQHGMKPDSLCNPYFSIFLFPSAFNSVLLQFYRYAYSEDTNEEFDKDESSLTLIKPSPIASKDVRTAPESRAVPSNNGTSNGDLEEDKTQ